MELKKDAKFVIGVDLGGTNVRAAVVDLSGKIVGEGRTDSRAMDGLDATVEQIISAIRLAVTKSPADLAKLQVRDVVLEFNNVPVENEGHLINIVSLTDVGKKVPLVVLRLYVGT